MNLPSLDHSGEASSPFCGISDHRCVFRSNILMWSSSSVPITRYRPSGDHRGPNTPTESGTVVTFRLSRPRMRMMGLSSAHIRPTIESKLVSVGRPIGKGLGPIVFGEYLPRAAALRSDDVVRNRA